jgi:hypothetical protein
MKLSPDDSKPQSVITEIVSVIVKIQIVMLPGEDMN